MPWKLNGSTGFVIRKSIVEGDFYHNNCWFDLVLQTRKRLQISFRQKFGAAGKQLVGLAAKGVFSSPAASSVNSLARSVVSYFQKSNAMSPMAGDRAVFPAGWLLVFSSGLIWFDSP
jgi:hypothetical protein